MAFLVCHDLFRGTKLVFHLLAVANRSDSLENDPVVLASIARTPLDPADGARTGASTDAGAQSLRAIVKPMTGPMGTLGPGPDDRARATRTTLAGARTQQRSGRGAIATAEVTRSE
jgi:hypothetical protein